MSGIPYSDISSIQFYVLGPKDNKIDSNVTIVHQDQFRDGLPFPGGTYDAHMGTTDHTWRCETCLEGKKLCPGHYGDYRLKIPVPSPLFIKYIIKWLKLICFDCGRPIIKLPKLKVAKDKLLNEYVKITRSGNKNIECTNCHKIHPHIVKDKSDPVGIYFEIYEPKSFTSQSTKPKLLDRSPLYPHMIAAILKKIPNDVVLAIGKPILCHPKKLMTKILRVPPNTIRPDVKKINSGRTGSNDLTILLQTILKINDSIPSEIPTIIDPDLNAQIHLLCLAVYDLIKGSTGTKQRGIVSASKKPLTAITRRLIRKWGRIRRNLMGRRARFVGRSFITGDTFRKLYEVGVPMSMARNIQYPVTVREYNYDEMMTYFMNGTKRYPGCVKVKKFRTGVTHWVGNIKNDFTLEIGDEVHRDIIDGDDVGFNRQPSLEPSSISSMQCVIMETGDTIRLNVSACALFNADFDGDAMNLIFTRSSRTRNEIRNLASPAQSFISYKDGHPKIGEVMDSIVGLAELTSNKTKMDKYHAMRLFNQVNIYHDFSEQGGDHIFTGRDIVSIYLRDSGNHINLTAKPSFFNSEHAQFRKYDPADIKVEINRGELISGVLDKATIGEGANGGVFHIIHNQYGPKAALDAVFYMQQIAISYLYNKGFSMSLGDLLLNDNAIEEIHKIEASLVAESLQITENLNQGKIISPIGKTLDEYYEEQQANALQPGNAFWEHVLSSIDPENNNMYKAIVYGARGKLFNFVNTVCAIGQLDINGSRIRENFDGRSLPYFSKYDSDPRARGYIANSYILGIAPTEFFFHAMESRYALINRSLSTSVTGMHNRMAVKNLESDIVDNQRKVMNGSRVIQFLYGDDAADPRFIERVKFPTMKADLTYAAFEKEFLATPDMFAGGKISASSAAGLDSVLKAEFEQLVADREFYIGLFLQMEVANSKPYEDVLPMPVNPNRIIEDTLYNLDVKSPVLDPISAVEKVKTLCNEIEYCLINSIQRKKKTPIPSYLADSCKLLKILLRSYLNLATLVRRKVNNEALEIIIKQIEMSYSKSLIDYGKAMGIIASQSISEPMTQMVLNSHHFSGAGSTKKKGMFRIKEVLNAKPTEKMKAPSMTLRVLKKFRKDKIKVQEIANHIEMLPLKQFVIGWQIFFEKYGEPVHPAYVVEKEFIKEFEKYHVHIKPPSDLTNWCFRIVLDKSKMIEKQMKMDTIYHKIRQEYPATYVVYSNDNADSIIMRIYLRNSFLKKGTMTVSHAVEELKSMLDLIVRGIRGIRAAYVKDTKINELQEDGSIAKESIYYIFTDGTNLKKILEDPYIDPDTVQSDSILETYELFGIGAARNKIVSELKHQVDNSSHRHYTIYADEMTHNGYVTSIDRYGSARRDSSILLRISDADPIKVIEESAINAMSDNLSGVSPPIMIGKYPTVGDLYNTFKWNEKMVKEKVQNLDSIIADL